MTTKNVATTADPASETIEVFGSDHRPVTYVSGADHQPITPAPIVEIKPPTPKRPRGLNPKQQQLALSIAKASFRGMTGEEIAKALGCSVPTVRRYKGRPDFQAICEAARASLRASSDETALVARADAIEVAAAIVGDYRRGAGGVSAKEALEATKVILAASAPTPAQYKQEARKALLMSLSGTTRALVANELRTGSSDFLDLSTLTDAELEALLGHQ